MRRRNEKDAVAFGIFRFSKCPRWKTRRPIGWHKLLLGRKKPLYQSR